MMRFSGQGSPGCITVLSSDASVGAPVTGESVTPNAVRGALDVRVGTALAFVVKTLPGLVSGNTVVHATSTPKVKNVLRWAPWRSNMSLKRSWTFQPIRVSAIRGFKQIPRSWRSNFSKILTKNSKSGVQSWDATPLLTNQDRYGPVSRFL